jgi:hypothetical protein
MLQTQTIEEKTLGLIKTLMSDEKLSQFSLVGGTALALYLGHRKSVDIDLFSQQLFDVEEMKGYLTHAYGFQIDRQSDVTLIGRISSVKVDCIGYHYPLVESAKKYEGIRMYSMPDIAAMKLTAISQSGKRLKDYVDVAFLSAMMSLNEMLNAFEKKYPKTSVMSAVRGLSYFDDIDFSLEIDLMDRNFKWKVIEKRLREMIKYSDRIFPQMLF